MGGRPGAVSDLLLYFLLYGVFMTLALTEVLISPDERLVKVRSASCDQMTEKLINETFAHKGI